MINIKRKNSSSRFTFKLCVRVSLFILLLSPVVFAQDYEIGAGDVLEVTFWQQPELNTTVTVRQDGKISLPVVGELNAEGLTSTELSSSIVENISYYNPNISQANVVVREFNSRRVYITGQVVEPGRYAFEALPNLWDAIKEAGGPTEAADLSRVRIVRGQTGEIETVDLERYFNQGNYHEIPGVSSNDNIDVPRHALSTEEGIIPRDFEGRRICYVYGAVSEPGVFNLDKGMDALDAIVLAGGPLPEANMSSVKVIRQFDSYSQITDIDIKKYSEKGHPPRLLLKPEDTVMVPRRSSFWHSFLSTFGDFMPVIIATTSTIIAVDAIND